ncbi:MAG: hydroxymethylbilane synthase [Proteobacteria bacterium]|nr:MAG: hydroxymethylbilane synthase [Pseudomonadota bacterium]
MNQIRIASRKSPLARMQSYAVGAALQAAQPGLKIEYLFKESLGDKNLTDPLWKMPERGVFTEDFVQDLLNESADLVVHSWKDLPTEPRPGLSLLGTLPRADTRDLLFFRPASLGKKNLTLLTSSPRRTFSAENHLKPLLPFAVDSIETKTVRGNVNTRIRKLIEGEGDGLFMAKAALDRLLATTAEEFAEARAELRAYVDQLNWMVLPLSLFPTAPAQGALAIEAKTGRTELAELVAMIHCPATEAAVRRERALFSSFGGGCHQKIGLTVAAHPRFGNLEFFYGHHAGETKHFIRADSAPAPLPVNATRWPLNQTQAFFEREAISAEHPGTDLFVARANALPAGWKLGRETVFTAGIETWRKLAERGVWVHGTTDGLGETLPHVEALAGRAPNFTKLTHDRSGNDGVFPRMLATYRLVPREGFAPPVVDAYFWSSYSTFERALELNPKIRDASHATGPGHTAIAVEKALGRPVAVYINYRHWKDGDPCANES